MISGGAVPASSSYLLSNHVHACCANQHLVFLDLKHDKYLCLDQDSTRVVGPVLRGWKAAPQGSGTGELQPSPDEVLCTLSAQQLVTQDESLGREARLAPICAPIYALRTGADVVNGSLGTRDYTSFFTAAAGAALELRWLPINHTVTRVRRRKDTMRAPREFDRDDASELIAKFHVMRPFFGKEYSCLFDSLALVDFLAKFDVYPSWVFGVKMDPFGAHCWIQEGDVVLNDTVEYVQDFTPIMAV